MKKLFLLSVLAILSSHVLAAPKEASTDTAKDSYCVTRGTDLKKKMKEVEDLLAANGAEIETAKKSKIISQ